MKCEICRMEIEMDSEMVTVGYPTQLQGTFTPHHKSCYDKSLIEEWQRKSMEAVGFINNGLSSSCCGWGVVEVDGGTTAKQYKCVNCGSICGIQYVVTAPNGTTVKIEQDAKSEVSPQEAKPTEDWVWYHGMSKEDLRITVQQGYLYQRRGEGMSPCTYLAKEQKEAEQYGEVLLKVIYNPTLHPMMNNYNSESWQIRVYEPIFEYNVVSNKDEVEPMLTEPQVESTKKSLGMTFTKMKKIMRDNGIEYTEDTEPEQEQEIEELKHEEFGYEGVNGGRILLGETHLLLHKINELVRVVNRLAKEIKQKAEKDKLTK